MIEMQGRDAFPTLEELRAECAAYERLPDRDAAYKLTDRAVTCFWPNMAEVTDAVGVLLLTWNAAFYRGNSPDLSRVQEILESRSELLTDFRKRDLLSFGSGDESGIRKLFDGLLAETAVSRKKGVKRTPVGVGKALHLLAPCFFPAWDGHIAAAYGCPWKTWQTAADRYLAFVDKTRQGLRELRDEQPLAEIEEELSGKARFPKTILKFIDEFNYMRYTRGRSRSDNP